MTNPTPPPLRKNVNQLLAELEEKDKARDLGDRTLPPTKRPPSKNAADLIRAGIREKSLRYHIAFWGALVGTPLGALLAYLSEPKAIDDSYWIVFAIMFVGDLLLIRMARLFSDRQLRKDLYCVYWREMFNRHSLPREKTILLSPAINILSLFYGFFSLARLFAIVALFGLAFALVFRPLFILLILGLGGAVYGCIRLCQEMVGDSKWRRLKEEVRRAAYN